MDELEKDNHKEENTKEEHHKEKPLEFKLDSLNLPKSSVLNILEDLRVIKKRFNHIENILKESERAQYRPSKDLPGIIGIFDGEFMVTKDGEKIEVPKNYAAKSLLVYGDELKKMVDDEGKEAFKILNKVDRKKIEGLLSKKDGRYVILADSGTFNLSKNAVEFRNIKQGEWILAVIPEKGPTGNFAAIDKVIVKEKSKDIKFFEPAKKEDKPQNSKPQNNHNQKPAPKPQQSFSQPKPVQIQQPSQPKTETPKVEAPKPSPMPKIEFSDDDLV